jgi:sugar/nucleoside kinase (ribokinase family)
MSRKSIRQPSIVVLGDINVDIVGRVKAWPKPGEDCLAQKLASGCGGVGANCAFGLARWGVATRLLGCVGRDIFSEYVLKILRASNVETRSVQGTTAAMTGMFYINVTPDGERTFFGGRGANAMLRLPHRGSAFTKGAFAAHIAGHSFLDRGPARAAKHLITAFHARGGWVSLDVGMEPSKTIPQKILQMARTVDILLVSLDEAAALTGTRDPFKAFGALRKAGAHEVVLKIGRRGCMISEKDRSVLVPSFSVRVKDSTGAGDAFVAAFLQARLRGWSAIEGAIAANAAGALATTVVGAGQYLPGQREVAALLSAQRLKGKWDEARKRILARLRHGPQHDRSLRGRSSV